MPNPETASLLREQIDDLSTRLLMGETGLTAPGRGRQDLLEQLTALGAQARDAGYAAVAEAASQLVEGLNNTSDSAAAEQRLREGLGRLAQAISDSRPAGPSKPAGPAPPASLGQDPELVSDFILESREHLASIEQRILTLEREPGNSEAIHSVFRGFHTIEGLAGFLEFGAIQEVAHEVETALNLAREGKLAVSAAVIDIILESVDHLNRAIEAVQSGAACERLPGHEGLLAKVQALITGSPAEAAPDKQAVATQAAAENTLEAAAPAAGDPKRTAAESFSVRVDTGKLDYLVDMVGEMVIAQSLVRHNDSLAAANDARLLRDMAQLARITGEVQRTAMAMRMVPIGQLFQRTARQVRDLSRKVGKHVELVTRGEDTELDKSIAEQISDPLMHMVRNAIDHGIEPPEARAEAGKAAQARITLAAYHQGGQIVIEVADDGRGLDPDKILAKARSRGLVQEGAHLSENDTFRLILEPGFSTAEQVTDISGRGVGMDVVRRQLEKLRGRIEIRTALGIGTTFLLKLPLTLAIIDGLVVTVGRHKYIVPLFAVREMFRPAPETLFTIEDRREMAMVRGRLLPLLRLYQRLHVSPRTEDPCQALLIVAEAEGRPFCMMVDDLLGKQEVVIKSLGEGIGKVPGLAGGAILGDGRVGLILDVGGLWTANAVH